MSSSKITMDMRRTDILTAGILAIAGLIILMSLMYNSPDNYLVLLSNKPLIIVLALIAITTLLLMRVLTKESRDKFRVQ